MHIVVKIIIFWYHSWYHHCAWHPWIVTVLVVIVAVLFFDGLIAVMIVTLAPLLSHMFFCCASS
jgi:hypothetical protein